MLQLAQKYWNYTTEGLVDSSPAVANGYVYVGCTKADAAQNDLPSNVYCLDATTGDKVWNFTIGRMSAIPLLQLLETCLYIGDWAHNVYCLNATTGAEIWNYTTGAHINSSPSIADGNVYVGSWDHSIYAFGARSGQTNSQLPPSVEIILIAIIVTIAVVSTVIFIDRRKGRGRKQK